MLHNFAIVGTFVLLGILLLLVTLLLSRVLQPRDPSDEKYSTYECGERPIGDAKIQFNNRFYIIALIFIVFDVEVVFMYPWGVVFKDLGIFAFLEMMVFMTILIVGLAYAWAKGDLDWVKRVYHDRRTDDLMKKAKEIG